MRNINSIVKNDFLLKISILLNINIVKKLDWFQLYIIIITIDSIINRYPSYVHIIAYITHIAISIQYY